MGADRDLYKRTYFGQRTLPYIDWIAGGNEVKTACNWCDHVIDTIAAIGLTFHHVNHEISCYLPHLFYPFRQTT